MTQAAVLMPRFGDKKGRRSAVPVADDSATPIIYAGEYAIIVSAGRGPPSGLVVVDHTRGALTERSIRRANQRKDGRTVLTIVSATKAGKDALLYPCHNAADNITIVGLVIGKYVPLVP